MHHRGHDKRNNHRSGGYGASNRPNHRGSGRSQHPLRNNKTHETDFNIQEDIASIEEVGNHDERGIRIAIQGCSHGCLDKIYEILEEYQRIKGPSHSIDLLLCCGDFQSLRNTTDYDTISIPAKYKEMGSFHHYYSGTKRAPILTIFIGGNHEASGYLQELYYGGWVAPNIYYLGAAGVVSFRGIRIAGLSGIYNAGDFNKGRFEEPPYNPSSLRSVYHYRNTEVARLKCLSRTTSTQPIDIVMSHDWPRGIERFGDTQALLRKKAYFAEEIRNNNLGSAPAEDLLYILKPKWWFSAHLHVKFHASVIHTDTKHPSTEKAEVTASTTSFIGLESNTESGHLPDLTDLMTQFLSLDKCLPRRRHLQIVNIPCPQAADTFTNTDELCYDLDWLSILQKTHEWTTKTGFRRSDPDISTIHVTDDDRSILLQRIQSSHPSKQSHDNILAIPQNFVMTALPYGTIGSEYCLNGGKMIGNPQTDTILKLLELEHIITVPYERTDGASNLGEVYMSVDANEINLDDL